MGTTESVAAEGGIPAGNPGETAGTGVLPADPAPQTRSRSGPAPGT